MRKTILSLCLAFLATASWAAPAKKGLMRVIRLTDGTELTVELKGDEFLHYYQAADGKCYTDNGNGTFVPFDLETGKANAMAKRAAMQQTSQKMKAKPLRSMQQNAGPNKAFGDGTGYYGKKKGLIILVEFPNKKFKSGHDNEFYTKLANKENYVEGVFKGSVRDYYYAQSNGQFELTFDVIGPITAPENYNYYGQNNASNSDSHVGTLVAWACKEVKDKVDFHDYDWDGDGYADQVFVLYAGPGENNTNNSDLIWPHMFYLSNSDIGQAIYINGVYVDTYACSCELNGYGTADGMGTICHEFSHCLGYPDLYDTTYSGSYGMDAWDLLHQGCYNGNGFSPANLTGYERWMAGWTTPVELKTDTVVSDMKSLTDYGETYIIYNEQNKNEFYFVDNRQRTGWDESIPGNGLLITHVDYNKKAWHSNSVNNDPNHERMTPFHADGWNNRTGSSMRTADGDPYPYQNNDSLTNTSIPAATLYNVNVDGRQYMNKAMLDMKRNGDGTMSFRFRGMQGTSNHEPGDVLFNETFNGCASTGGNDGIFNKGANGSFKPDVAGWTYSNKAYGANKCARFGTVTLPGDAITPIFSINGKTVLTFKAAPWLGKDNTLDVFWGNQMLKRIFMDDGKWTDVTIEFEGTGYNSLTFSAEDRFFLDEVKVMVPSGETGIVTVKNDNLKNVRKGVYTIDGRYLGTDVNRLGKGLYIVDGKKMVK